MALATTPKSALPKKQPARRAPKVKPLSAVERGLLFTHRAREDFATYCYYVMPNYKEARHLDLLHEKLMRIESGESTRDQTFMPPQHGKTVTASILFAAWYLGRHPDHKIIFATYSQDLADLRGSEIRAVMQSEAHMRVFPDCVIAKDTNSKSEFALTAGGSLVALGRKAGGTGRSANGFILDDITKDQNDADSAANRLEVKNFYSGVVMTRLLNKTWIHIINTRWHEDDLSGWTLSEHAHVAWDVLTLTAICDDELADPLGRKIGNALWPEQQDEALLLDKKKSSTARQWAAIYQQQPVPDGGLTFKAEDWRRRDEVAAPGEKPYFVVQACDTASKDGTQNDWTVIQTWELYKRGPYLRHVLRKRINATNLQSEVVAHAALHSPNLILVEDASSGLQLIQTLKGDGNLPIVGIKPTLNKQLKFQLAAMVWKARAIAIPGEGENDWILAYRTELLSVPASKFDDQADATAIFILWFDAWIRSSQVTIIKSGRTLDRNQFNGFNNA